MPIREASASRSTAGTLTVSLVINATPSSPMTIRHVAVQDVDGTLAYQVRASLGLQIGTEINLSSLQWITLESGFLKGGFPLAKDVNIKVNRDVVVFGRVYVWEAEDLSLRVLIE